MTGASKKDWRFLVPLILFPITALALGVAFYLLSENPLLFPAVLLVGTVFGIACILDECGTLDLRKAALEGVAENEVPPQG